jgi:tRNA-dihydrouridine synthase B
MAYAAEMLDERENVLLDVNMGCPVPKVVKNGDGSALLRDPEKAGRIVEAMCAKTKKPVTVKMRAGWDADSVNAVEVARVLETAGAAMLCVHGRTREQYYGGKSDWDVIARVKAAVSIPVIGNGDVLSYADAERMAAQTGCDHVMIGRGALGNPWVFKGGGSSGLPSTREKAEMFMRHAQLTAEDKGKHMAVLEMRKHAGWYFKGMPGSARLRASVNKITNLEELLMEIDMFISAL